MIWGTATISGTVFDGNTAPYGNDVYNYGTLTCPSECPAGETGTCTPMSSDDCGGYDCHCYSCACSSALDIAAGDAAAPSTENAGVVESDARRIARLERENARLLAVIAQLRSGEF